MVLITSREINIELEYANTHHNDQSTAQTTEHFSAIHFRPEVVSGNKFKNKRVEHIRMCTQYAVQEIISIILLYYFYLPFIDPTQAIETKCCLTDNT